MKPNAAMDNDAKQALLSDQIMVDHVQQMNENNALQRRRNRQYGTSTTTASSSKINSLLKENGAEDQSLLDFECSRTFKQQFDINQVIILLAAYLGGGTLCFFLVRNQIEGKKTNGVLDAMCFCVVTMITVGYGDLVPNSILAKLLACVYVFIGVALAGLILGKVADYLMEKQETLLVRAIYIREKVGSPELLKEVETHKVKYKFLTSGALILVLMIIGTVILSVVEDLQFMDAIYCVCSTITTLGYGDESFSSKGGRIFAVFWILGSTICLAQFYLYLAELYTEGRQKSLMKWVLTRKLTHSDLEEADLDHDEAVR
ncbi:LOW QUALITY PROTEIN: two-pore potassium channel 1 [Ziziphus jujuba]|uniref:LOW QUALITY PROTEIN: two-pore potassium channel 1 n=1 Tax=Ziziphus jujuba TaxID=326968 RepID=A0ABM4AAI3_ZIZJJ|nr:LOW QUALITY PROTEIN: two-pore potassium channel 1 [Ziziphus jujuba]